LLDEPGKEIRCTGKKRLVEECKAVTISEVGRTFGKNALRMAVRKIQSIQLPVLGGSFDLWLIDQPHPGSLGHLSSLESGNNRLWLQCHGCRQKVGKLFYFYLASDSLMLSDLLCRTCHGLVYQSQNCGGNRWYRETARPFKRLLIERSKLLATKRTQHVANRLTGIDDEIRNLRQKLRPKTERGRARFPTRLKPRQRRPYRELALLEHWLEARP
jgi:hypothetical protein